MGNEILYIDNENDENNQNIKETEEFVITHGKKKKDLIATYEYEVEQLEEDEEDDDIEASSEDRETEEIDDGEENDENDDGDNKNFKKKNTKNNESKTDTKIIGAEEEKGNKNRQKQISIINEEIINQISKIKNILLKNENNRKNIQIPLLSILPMMQNHFHMI